ncbi:S8 family serine peptidase [Synoicihabitans lomoniglobus]|uniref:S8 family serine peptidase n=1 Tax=Synoicihabitans lomoniglobus TaxID=2909285 RepID=A0AAF0CS01_9BACT|nr:S8 family serine peptidase [Opitutaceae bacterium LMO-M01]WED67013.1 S8 family serine peptidase [Opitutaceae bacterium LMO-M01]
MLELNRRRAAPRCVALALAFVNFAAALPAAEPTPTDFEALRSGLIPKEEVGANAFLAEHPTYDGRDVVIAIFDTGVDPAAAGMAVTTTGERKVVDMIDASGSGDVDTSTVVQRAEDGALAGLSGRSLSLPDGVVNPSGDFRLGLKSAEELFQGAVLRRLTGQIEREWQAKLSRVRAERERTEDVALKAARKKAAADRTRAEADLVARADLRDAVEDGLITDGPVPSYDCVVWHDGEFWRVLVDTDRDADLADETVLRPYGIDGEYGTFDAFTHATFGVQVYEGGDLLSIVTVSGTHGTHVASIASSHYPDDPSRNGVAPGARILSIKIGDIRTGGSSYGISESRALATAARYGVDLVNASWGGASIFQDGQDSNAGIYRALVERYDILAILSAGNEGPGLSTAGSAGGEASRLVGVGAYASTAMAKALYNSVKDSPNAALQFTSRGPTKDGDIGVDVMAPGAAWASYSAESLKGAEMINGTSMASPSVAGVAALVISAAKQNNIAATPVLMRNALILGAADIPEEDEMTRGRGMANAPGAWAKLQDIQNEPAFGAFYDLDVSGGTFTESGRGLYLREAIDEPSRRVAVGVQPAWSESVPTDAQYGWEADFVLTPADDWVQAPEYLHLANGRQSFSVLLNIPAADAATRERGGVLTSRIDAHLVNQPELGVVWSMPITIVRPAETDVFTDQHLKTSVTLQPAETARLFYTVPPGMDKLQLRAKHVADDPVARRFFIQALTVAAESSQTRFKADSVHWVEEGDEMVMNIPVKPGGVTELALNQYFYSADPATLQLDLEWAGVGVGGGTITVEPNVGWTPVEINPPARRSVEVEAQVSHGISVHLPQTTKVFHDDERNERPATTLRPESERADMMRVSYTLDFKEATKAALADQQDYDFSEVLGGGRALVVHESGEVLYNGFPDLDAPISFPKGKSTIISEWLSGQAGAVDAVKTYPMRVAVALDSPKSLSVAPNLRGIFNGRTISSLDLRPGRENILMLKDSAVDELAEISPAPDYFIGEMVFKDEEDHEIVKQSLVYLAGHAPSKTTDQDPKAKPAEDLKSDDEKFADALADLQLKFVREHRMSTDVAVMARRTAVLSDLLASRPEDPAPLIEQAIDGAIAAGLASDIWGEAKPAESDEGAEGRDATESPTEVAAVMPMAEAPDLATILGWLDSAEASAKPTEVSQFFGAKPVAAPGDLAARDRIAAQEKKLNTQREALAQINLLRADLHRGAGDLEAAWLSWAEIGRWESKPADNTAKLEAKLYREAGLLGLALQALNTQIEEDGFNAGLLKKRIELYRELDWKDVAEQQERVLALRAHRQALMKKL